ncbi:MAG TPA: amidohydrolase [Candidatus Eisenbergiella stercorigallinarum]|uniref:Amidohydrolase n=1 Tax=Candidatus Eisenbergiella stercorigallinarum TaxID=2838557 RepID=A0A9D2QXR4_9FIRM|nr:amidohydrolase [Candidatus Eisenbergiella stercorigallinarum]
MDKKQMFEALERKKQQYFDAADRIWEHPETSFEEYFAADLLCGLLEKEGFAVTRPLAGMETAFLGRFGSGHPVIGILGEYDALYAMSQEADAAQPKPTGEKGHGCGHNLLGAGSLAAAVAVKDYLQENGKEGTVIYYGCPGEEGGSGKAFMAREGVFDGLDAALTWHPGDINAANSVSTLAVFKVHYHFTGRAAHAAACPQLGRSALDAAELMNIGTQFLREHIIPEARIHYAIVNAGGKSPNVVQPEAENSYYIRAPRLSQVRELKERVDDIARGAALMTGTSVDIRMINSTANVIPNDVLSDVMARNLQEAPLPVYTQEEREYAKTFVNALEAPSTLLSDMAAKLGEKAAGIAKLAAGREIYDFPVPNFRLNMCLSSSSDVGDVSWNCPTSQIMAATMAAGTPSHSWQRTAQGKSAVAHKGMLYAAKVIAGSAVDLLEDPKLLKQARQEYDRRLGGETYVCDIPADAKPVPTESDE